MRNRWRAAALEQAIREGRTAPERHTLFEPLEQALKTSVDALDNGLHPGYGFFVRLPSRDACSTVVLLD